MKRAVLVAVLTALASPVFISAIGLEAPAAGAPANASAPNCSSVTEWYYVIPGVTSYYAVHTGSGWVVSYSADGSNPFATTSISISGASWRAHSVYIGQDYTADASGTLASDCSIGFTTPLGHWSDNHGQSGSFQMTAFARAQSEISGTVVDGSGKGIAGAQVNVGATAARTDSSGSYSVTLSPGSYAVSAVRPSQGEYVPSVCSGTIKGSACDITLTSGDHATASFELSCQAPSGARDARARSAAASTVGCPLDVAVKGNLTLTSGLTHRAFRNPDVARFYSGSSETSSEACQSGCTDITVTVTDPAKHNKPVSGAKVDASVQPITQGLAPYPSGEHPGDGYLCLGGLPASSERCGNGSHEVTDHTDEHGQVKLRYWAPGVLQTEHVVLTVKAQEECTQSSCPAGHKQGEANPQLAVQPNVLIGTASDALEADLEAKDAYELAIWTTGTTLKHFEEFLAIQGAEKLISTAITHALEAEAELPVAIANIIREYNALNKEELGFMSLILNSFHVRMRGLGIESAAVRPRPGPLPGRPFLVQFAADDGPFGANSGGLTWQYGQELVRLPRVKTQQMHLRIFEVSYCEQGQECGPGYSGTLIHRYDGIHPYLYIEFRADRGPLQGERGTQGVYSKSLIVPYNAEAWMRSQFGG